MEGQNERPLSSFLPPEVFYYLTSEREQRTEMGCESHLYSLTLKDEKYLSIIPGIIQAHCIGKCDISLSLQSQGQEIRTYSAEQTSVILLETPRHMDEFSPIVRALEVQLPKMSC